MEQEQEQFGLSVKITDLCYLDGKRDTDLHKVKSFAGKIFHSPFIESICVYDMKGRSRLYLRKTPFGVYREEKDYDD